MLGEGLVLAVRTVTYIADDMPVGRQSGGIEVIALEWLFSETTCGPPRTYCERAETIGAREGTGPNPWPILLDCHRGILERHGPGCFCKNILCTRREERYKAAPLTELPSHELRESQKCRVLAGLRWRG
jgi:hypothetical protein